MKIDTIEPFFSLLISECLDFVMRSKRQFIKELNLTQITRFCETLLKSLKDQEQRVN